MKGMTRVSWEMALGNSHTGGGHWVVRIGCWGYSDIGKCDVNISIQST